MFGCTDGSQVLKEVQACTKVRQGEAGGGLARAGCCLLLGRAECSTACTATHASPPSPTPPQAFPDAYVRLVAFDARRQVQVAGFLVHRPSSASEWKLPNERSV